MKEAKEAEPVPRLGSGRGQSELPRTMFLARGDLQGRAE